MSLTARVLLALAAGLSAGSLVSLAESPSLFAIAAAVEPVGILWVSALEMTVIPLVVSLLVAGITSVAQARVMGRLAAKALALFLAMISAAAVFTALVAPALFSKLKVDPASAASLREGAAMAGGERQCCRLLCIG